MGGSTARLTRCVLTGTLLTTALVAACGPAPSMERLPVARLLVANALDGSVTEIDPHRPDASGRALPVGPAPWQVANGPSGSLVVLSSAVDHVGHLVHAKPPPRAGAEWKLDRIAIGLRMRSGYLASDGTPTDGAADRRPGRSALLPLDPDTLAPVRLIDLPIYPRRLTLSGEGGGAFALDDSGTVLLSIDLASGVHRRIADLPAMATSLAVAHGAVYVPHAYGTSVWRIDPVSGTVTHTIPVGRHPTAITFVTRP